MEGHQGVRIAIVVAVAENRVIGRGGALPWRMSSDLKRFRRLTWGKPIIMGRKTFESIGKPLDGRDNIVVSRNSSFRCTGVHVASNFEAALELAIRLAVERGVNEVVVVGGANLYQAALPYAERIYLTQVHGRVGGDTTFPGLDLDQWREIERIPCLRGSKDDFCSDFVIYERKAGAVGLKPIDG
jgi:dihydrofolate reductase